MEYPKNEMKKLSNPRLKPETRKKILTVIAGHGKACFDLVFTRYFQNFPSEDKQIIIDGIEPFYAYYLLIRHNQLIEPLGTEFFSKVLIKLFQHNHFEYIKFLIEQYAQSELTVLSEPILLNLFFNLIIEYNNCYATKFIYENEMKSIIPEEFRQDMESLYIISKLSGDC